ncbi:NAD/NADP-dependent octopine/nopaline dehydrogenase family protein [Clostridium tagluense]|uniref:NAD/NADP-dependent octopine/nopaline dehydrogenase family protein n=1 Tax=Clostridium tagluense TaxID=360422 RepID=UPI001CF2CD08|nr:NAD/NADP-dependent octopine/nopaline dehydrogenase family protein [Clostridium tagluense]MCB2300454.1 NAD/NADP octopine/nopaline dehydrogenase family protein [Clostridium tagluense]
MNICILGGGNLGTLVMGDIGRREDISVRLLTSRPDDWNHIIEVCDNDGIFKYSGRVDIISSNPEEVISDADIIISTLPSYMFNRTIQKIKPFLKAGVWIGMMPGNGGSECYCKELIESGCTLFGFQRVYGIARIKEYGKSVYDLGKKKELFIGAIPSCNTTDVCRVIEDLFNVKCNPLANYLHVALTPANPILHTARLYEMFHNYSEGVYWEKMISFYTEWTDEASTILLACDEEVQILCRRLATVDLKRVGFVKEYFGAETPQQMTAKISNMISLKNIQSPMIVTEEGYIPDFKSRYFMEDFPFGLCIIKSFSEIVGVEIPLIDKILMWFEKVTGVEYYVDGKFEGKDLKNLPLPQNFGINSPEDIIAYYR